MRISDWSSDVCSSDLIVMASPASRAARENHPPFLSSSRMRGPMSTVLDQFTAVGVHGSRIKSGMTKIFSPPHSRLQLLLQRDIGVEQLRYRAVLLRVLGDFGELGGVDAGDVGIQLKIRAGDRKTVAVAVENHLSPGFKRAVKDR